MAFTEAQGQTWTDECDGSSTENGLLNIAPLEAPCLFLAAYMIPDIVDNEQGCEYDEGPDNMYSRIGTWKT